MTNEEKIEYTKHALLGLGWEIEQMKNTPMAERDDAWFSSAFSHLENEVVRIANGNVSEDDLIG